MVTNTTRAALLAAAALSLAGCDPTWELEFRVTVPEGARDAVGSYPMVLLETLDDPAVGPVHAGLLMMMCEPPTGDLVVDGVRTSGLGRYGPRRVATVWLQPFPPTYKSEKCGSRPWVPTFGELEIQPTAWRASASVFQTPTWSDVAQLELAPP